MSYLSRIARSESDPKVVRSGPSSLTASDRLGNALGWFSFGLGLVELLAPRQVTRMLGMNGQESLVRAYGAREIGAGILSLSIEKKLGLWSRVAGDGIDIATLIAADRTDNPKTENVRIAMAMVATITLLDLVAALGATVDGSATSGNRGIYRGRTGFPGGRAAERSLA